MDKSAKKPLNEKLKLPFIVALVGVLILVIGMFLPYVTAAGKMADYIENNPDRIEIKDLGLTASDLKNVPIVSVSKLVAGAYGADDGAIANVFVVAFGGFLALTALFVILKKPIAVILFDLLAWGVFAFLNTSMEQDFIGPDKYAWGISYHLTLIAATVVLAGAIWMLVKKISAKNELTAISYMVSKAQE